MFSIVIFILIYITIDIFYRKYLSSRGSIVVYMSKGMVSVSWCMSKGAGYGVNVQVIFPAIASI